MMIRTTAYKAIYFLVFVLVVAAVIAMTALAFRTERTAFAIAGAVIFVLLLLPGRVQAYYWSELLAGLHYLNARDYATSKAHSVRFLEQLRARPRLRHLVWLNTSSYSRNAEVLALNNLGAAELELGETEAARQHLARAIELDPACPLPYRNMSTLVLRTATYAEALPWLQKAQALGFTGGWTDKLVMSSQRRNASVSTAGVGGAAKRPAVFPERAIAGAFIVELVNDAKTPFEFVISALEQVFAMTGAEAITVARVADRDGRAACAAFETEAAAQGKVEQVAALARAAGFPLACVVRS